MFPCRVLAAVVGLCVVGHVQAQVVFVPQPTSRGVGFLYQRRNLTIGGFVGGMPAPLYAPVYPQFYPSTVIEHRVYVAPAPLILPVRRFGYDLSGIDLDVEPPEKLDPRWPNVPPRKPPEVAKRLPPKEMLPEKPKAQEPKPPPPAKEKQDEQGLNEPRAEPVAEARRLVDLGLIAFQRQEYSLAAFRFQQATDVDPAGSRAFFLLGQAGFALGKFKDAAKSIESGMRRQPNWPLSAFRPRVDLYTGIEADWFAHKKQLEIVVSLYADQSAYLFLLGHQLWFEGFHEEAAVIFRRARASAADPMFVDRFLDLVPPAPVVGK